METSSSDLHVGLEAVLVQRIVLTMRKIGVVLSWSHGVYFSLISGQFI